MKLVFNKISTALVISLSSFSGMAYAGLDSDRECCDLQWGCGKWSTEVCALYWTAKEDGLTYGSEYRGNQETPFGNQTPFQGDVKYKNFDFDWNIGYRVAVEYLTPTEIEFGLTYTHFNTHAKGHGESEGSVLTGGVQFYPTFVTSDNFVTVADDAFTANFKINIDMIDFTLGRELNMLQCVSLTPFVGVRGAKINQKYHSRSFTSDYALLEESDLEVLKMSNQYEGVGLRGGFETQWKIGKGLSINALIAFSALWGEHKVTYDDQITAVVAGTLLNDFFQKNHYEAFRGVSDLGLGFSYDYQFGCDSVIMISLDWEHHLFFNQNRLEENGVQNNLTAAQHDRGDLGISGVTLSVGYQF